MDPSTPTQPSKRIAIAIELDHAVPWHLDCYQGILQYAEQHGWHCVVDPYLVGMKGQSGIADYDGVVGRISAEVAEAAAEHNIPVVNHWQNTPVDDLPSVLLDRREGARLAGEHLAVSGYQRFAHIGRTGDIINELEIEGLMEAIAPHGYSEPLSLDFPNGFESNREGVVRMRRVLTDWLTSMDPPVGVFVQASHTARYLAQICGEMGLRVPHDVGIVVHLGDNVIVSNASPKLSAVDTDYFGLGFESAQLLDRLMRGKQADPLQRFIAPKRIVVRESSDVFISADPIVSGAMRFIADHCRKTLRVEDVAEALDTSRRTLERRFEEVLGRSVYSEISRLRTDYIKRLLVDTDRPLSTVAEDCGFGSASHFTRFFRKEVGVTPSYYRKDQRSSLEEA